MQDFKFPKQEKVVSKNDIDLLFTKVNFVRNGILAIRYVWREKQEGELPVRVLMIVPKKRIKSAVDRNRIKRQLREVYRLNKGLIPNSDLTKTLLVAIMYQGKVSPDYKEMETCFHKMAKDMEKKMQVH